MLKKVRPDKKAVEDAEDEAAANRRLISGVLGQSYADDQ